MRFPTVLLSCDMLFARKEDFYACCNALHSIFNIGKGVYVVRNKDAPMCPECGVLMSGYDHRKRKAIGADGKPRIFLIRRLRCPVCRQLHAEIPDSLIPYKHYASEVIKTVQQGDDSLCPADDSTIRRWKK